MKDKRRLVRFIALLAVAFLTLSLAIGQVAGQEPGPDVPGQEHDVYLPLVQKAPNTLYGRVTDGGVAAPGVSLTLWFYNGSVWNNISTTTTDSIGNYIFTGMPALLASQRYEVRYDNPGSDTTRLWNWETRELTSFPNGSVVNIGNFDLANVVFSSPAPGSEAVPPQSFQWSRRPTTPSDSYQFNLLDIYDNNPSFVGPPVGYASSYTLGSLPALFQYCNPYFWGVKVNSPDGGWGMSYWVYLVTLHQTALSGIHGCVTLGGTPVSDISLELRLWDDSAGQYKPAGTVTTNANGYYAFTNKSGLTPPDEYYVRYINSTNASRLWYHETKDLTSYASGSSVFIGDFDIANIPLVSPSDGSTVGPNQLFEWTRRPATQTDNYEFDLWGNNPPYPFYYITLGYASNYLLPSLPPGFSYYTQYWWETWAGDPFGGWGESFQAFAVTFSTISMSVEPTGNPEALVRPDPELLPMKGMRLTRLSQTQDQMRQHPVYAGLRNLQVEP